MTSPGGGAATAFDVADRIRGKTASPWDVYGERIRRFEIHLNGSEIEMVRGPVAFEGFGLRLIAPRNGGVGVGFAASSDRTPEGVDATLAAATGVSQHASFPAKRVEFTGSGAPGTADLDLVDRALWEDPVRTLESFSEKLLEAAGSTPGVEPSFGSIRGTLAEVTYANSAGAHSGYSHTLVELEVAVKASGGAEGAPPGEYWVNSRARHLDSRKLVDEARSWATKAEDARHAKAPPNGKLKVVFPASVLSEILPVALGFRMSGSAELRKMTPTPGTQVAADAVTVVDDGLLPGAVATAPHDDEGTPQRRGSLVDAGKSGETLYDLLHAEAAGRRTTGNGRREQPATPAWFRFVSPPSPAATTLSIRSGGGGSDAEMIEATGDGIWLDQLGWAFPDPVSTAFGGEIRLGYRIRNGKLAEPLRGGTVGGVILTQPSEMSFLKAVTAVGGVPSLIGNLHSPTLLVSNVDVAGA
ncbi:MAG: TldD/PmbA family protein [Thermoplasmata archaeon]|nr:TldD/PmbA family protein [Thermoplasmata archaeon]